MSAEENKTISRRLHEAWNTSDEAAANAAVLALDFQAHFGGGPPLGRDAYIGFNQMFSAAFPDGQVSIEGQVTEGDKVAYRARFQGTHRGAFQGIPATDKRVSMTGIGIDRLAGGMVVETWMEFDTMGLLQQLGAISAPT